MSLFDTRIKSSQKDKYFGDEVMKKTVDRILFLIIKFLINRL